MHNNRFSKILVAIDGSEYSTKAFEYAIDISNKYGSKIVLFHVIVSPVYAYGIEGTIVLEPDERLTADGRNILKIKRDQAMKEGIEVESKLVEGHPSEKIVIEANEGSYDLVVMGSRGLGRVKSFLLGSISDRVSHYSECPVLIVKP